MTALGAPSTSPAIDAGDDFRCPLRDQRGITRPKGAHCDIGAVELVVFPSPSPSPTPSPVAAYTIAASASGGGTVTSAGTTSYNDGTVASYSAAAAAGQTFTGWTLDGTYVGYASPLTITVNSNRTLVATFVATPTFSDISLLSAADQQMITFLAARGIINPAGVNGSGQFQPGGDVARAEIAAFIARAFGWGERVPRE